MHSTSFCGKVIARLRGLTREKRLLQTIVSENMDERNKLEIPKTDYSKIAKCYDKVRIEPGALLSRIVKYGEIMPKSRVLDIGCGTGKFSYQPQGFDNMLTFRLGAFPGNAGGSPSQGQFQKHRMGSGRRTTITFYK